MAVGLTIVVSQMSLACGVLLVVQAVAPGDVDGLILLPRALGVVAGHRMHVGALLVVCGPCASLRLVLLAQRLLLRWLVGMVHIVLMLLVGLRVLVCCQETLAVTSRSLDSSIARIKDVAARLVALATYSGVHALIHPVELVLGLGSGFLRDAAIGVTRRAHVLSVASGDVVTSERLPAHGRVLLLAVVPQRAPSF